MPGTIREGVRLGLGDGILRRLMVRSALLGMVLAGVELLSPGTFAGLLGGEEKATGAYGFLAAAAFTASALGAGLAPAAAARLGGGARAAAVMSWLAAPAAIAVAIPFIGGAAVGYIGIYLLLGVGGPLTSELLHSRVGASQRTTMLSVESLALQAGGVVSNLLLGTLVVATSAGAGFLVIAVCLLARRCVALRDPGSTEGRNAPDGSGEPPPNQRDTVDRGEVPSVRRIAIPAKAVFDRLQGGRDVLGALP